MGDTPNPQPISPILILNEGDVRFLPSVQPMKGQAHQAPLTHCDSAQTQMPISCTGVLADTSLQELSVSLHLMAESVFVALKLIKKGKMMLARCRK